MLKKTKLILLVSLFSIAAKSTVFSDGPRSKNRENIAGIGSGSSIGLVIDNLGRLEFLEMIADYCISQDELDLVDKLDLSDCELCEKPQEEIDRLFPEFQNFTV